MGHHLIPLPVIGPKPNVGGWRNSSATDASFFGAGSLHSHHPHLPSLQSRSQGLMSPRPILEIQNIWFFFNIYLFTWLHQVSVATCGVFFALYRIFPCGAQTPWCPSGSVVTARWLHCSSAHRILVPPPGIEPGSPVFQSGFLTTGPPWKSLFFSLSKAGL